MLLVKVVSYINNYDFNAEMQILYFVYIEKLLENDVFMLKQLKRWLGENTILATSVGPKANYA